MITLPGASTATPEADICLLLEGTFPYVRGGVSTWVKQIIEGMPHLRFSIIYLGADAETLGEPAYELPANVVHIETHLLLEHLEGVPARGGWRSRVQALMGAMSFRGKAKRSRQYAINSRLHSELRHCKGSVENTVVRRFTDLLTGPNAFSDTQLQQSRGAWETIREKYNEAPEGLDFNHFFWTVRSMHAPLFILASIVSSAPQARVYHSVSTGYAGFLGALLQSKHERPYMISEHGIYTKERELDLAQVEWIPEELDPFKVGLNDNMSYLRSVWIRFFLSLGKMAYSSADSIFTLYEGNRQRQISDGADEHKLSIIPNGVNVGKYRAVRRSSTADVPPVLALIGRVVPIKDIKTFIRAMRIVRTQLPDAQGWLFGPEEEDEAYTLECKLLVKSLGLEEVVRFKGFGKPDEIFPQVGLSVLTSVSEGQPLVVLEGFAAGIPAVTTDVGSCRELIEGVDDQDRAIGSAGAVVPIADPSAFAHAAVALLSDGEAWQRASMAARTRVETYYDEKDMIARYNDAYQQLLSGGHHESAELPEAA